MGHAYNYRCGRCGFEEQFYQGHGFMVHSQPLKDYLQNHRMLFHYKTQQVLQNLSAKNPELFLKAGFQVYKCPKCKILQDKTEVVVFNGDTVVHKSEFRCSTCRSRMKLTNIHRLKKAICPSCGKRTFQMNHKNTVLWD